MWRNMPAKKKQQPKYQHLPDADCIVLPLGAGRNIVAIFNVTGICPGRHPFRYYFDWLREYPETFWEPRLTLHIKTVRTCPDIWLSIPTMVLHELPHTNNLILFSVPRPAHDMTLAEIYAQWDKCESLGIDLTSPTAQEILAYASAPVVLGSLLLREDMLSVNTDGSIH